MSAQRKIIALAILAAIAVAALFWKRTGPVSAGASPKPAVASVAQTPPPEPSAPLVEAAAPAVPSVVVAPSPPAQPLPKKNQPSTPPNTKPPKEPLHDPDARDALARVGLDPDAEQYWLAAIYDTSLPDKEREDLMEDLNEVGFADPENPTADDLPLIVNRLQIIEELEPDIHDPFMSEHLGEAYKDLANMYARASGQ